MLKTIRAFMVKLIISLVLLWAPWSQMIRLLLKIKVKITFFKSKNYWINSELIMLFSIKRASETHWIIWTSSKRISKKNWIIKHRFISRISRLLLQEFSNPPTPSKSCKRMKTAYWIKIKLLILMDQQKNNKTLTWAKIIII